MATPQDAGPVELGDLDSRHFVDVELCSESLRQNALKGVMADWATRQPFYAYKSGLPVLVCARARDVREVYNDPRRFTVEAPPYDAYKVFDIFGGLENVLQMDGERHDRIRRLMAPAFSPAAVHQLEGAIDAIIREKLDRIEASGPGFDAMADFSRDIIVRVLLDASFHLTPEQQNVFARMHDNISLATQFRSGEPLPEDFLNSVMEVRRVIMEIVDQRRAEPGDDMISRLVTARDEGSRLTDEELFGQINAICAAGLGSTAASLGAALLTLLRHRDQWQLLKREPERVDAAIEECLRFHGPGIHVFTRFAVGDTVLGGTPVPGNIPVIAAMQAASYDPEEYDDPLRFDITRNPRNILTFGGGPHFCIGNRLARLIMKRALLAMIKSFPDLQLADPFYEPEYGGFPGELCLKSLPLRTH